MKYVKKYKLMSERNAFTNKMQTELSCFDYNSKLNLWLNIFQNMSLSNYN